MGAQTLGGVKGKGRRSVWEEEKKLATLLQVGRRGNTPPFSGEKRECYMGFKILAKRRKRGEKRSCADMEEKSSWDLLISGEGKPLHPVVITGGLSES